MKKPTKGGLGLMGFGIAMLFAISCGATRLYNMAWNNKDIKTRGRHTISHATGLLGHNEYTRYNNGSADLKIYPKLLGHRTLSSKLYQDFDGDGLVDRIRINGPEWQMNRLKDILVRDADYEQHRDQFEKADRLLAKERERYQQKHGQ